MREKSMNVIGRPGLSLQVDKREPFFAGINRAQKFLQKTACMCNSVIVTYNTI